MPALARLTLRDPHVLGCSVAERKSGGHRPDQPATSRFVIQATGAASSGGAVLRRVEDQLTLAGCCTDAAELSITRGLSALVTSIRRAFAFSATGIVTVSTPFS